MNAGSAPRRLQSGLGLVFLVAGALVALVPVDADAAALAKAGWWWRVNDGSVPLELPTPPNVPEGGLMVAGAPDGATAIAALHFDLSDTETSPVLTLSVTAGGDVGGDTAILAACVTGSAWEPAASGNWNFKPFPACDVGSVNGIRSDDHTSWTFAVESLVSDGMVDVTIVPGIEPDQPAGANGSSFQLVFDAPTAASLVTTPGAAPATDLIPPDYGSSSPGGFDVPAIGGLDLPAIPSGSGFTPALPPGDQGLTATAPAAEGRRPPLSASPVSSGADHRGLAVLVLVLCGGALVWSAQLPVPAPRRLGTFGTDGPPVTAGTADLPATSFGGIGRFARARSGGAPPL